MPTIERTSVVVIPPQSVVLPMKVRVGLPTPSGPTQQSHVFQRLKLHSARLDADDPYWAEIITGREFLAASDHYGVEREVALEIRLGKMPYARAIRDGLIQRMIAWTTLYDEVDVDGKPGKPERELSTAEPIIVGELHSPPVLNASATFESTSTDKSKIGLEVTAAGVGGGGWVRERVYTDSSKLSVETPNCSLLCATLSGHYVLWRNLNDPHDVLVLTNVTGVNPVFPSPLTDYPEYVDGHLCPQPTTYQRFKADVASGGLVASRDYVHFKTPVSSQYTYAQEWETTREYSGHWGFETEFGGLPLSGAVTYTSTFTDKIKVEVSCPKGYDYVGRFRSSRELPQQWGAAPL